jgi:hypothetical protein
MVEVFKTDVNDRATAARIISDLNQAYPSSRVNFDLEDCDNILRIESPDGPVPVAEVITIVGGAGRRAEVLPDEVFQLQLPS